MNDSSSSDEERDSCQRTVRKRFAEFAVAKKKIKKTKTKTKTKPKPKAKAKASKKTKQPTNTEPRAPNWDEVEIRRLIEAVDANQRSCFKGGNLKSHKSERAKGWSKVLKQFPGRTSKGIRYKWSKLASNTRGKYQELRRLRNGTGGGPYNEVKITPNDELVGQILGPECVEGIPGGGLDTSNLRPAHLGPSTSRMEYSDESSTSTSSDEDIHDDYTSSIVREEIARQFNLLVKKKEIRPPRIKIRSVNELIQDNKDVANKPPPVKEEPKEGPAVPVVPVECITIEDSDEDNGLSLAATDVAVPKEDKSKEVVSNVNVEGSVEGSGDGSEDVVITSIGAHVVINNMLRQHVRLLTSQNESLLQIIKKQK